jgi:hypothetical protein
MPSRAFERSLPSGYPIVPEAIMILEHADFGRIETRMDGNRLKLKYTLTREVRFGYSAYSTQASSGTLYQNLRPAEGEQEGGLHHQPGEAGDRGVGDAALRGTGREGQAPAATGRGAHPTGGGGGPPGRGPGGLLGPGRPTEPAGRRSLSQARPRADGIPVGSLLIVLHKQEGTLTGYELFLLAR